MKVVCDTNVLIAALVADGLCRDIVKRRLLLVDLFTSKAAKPDCILTCDRTYWYLDASRRSSYCRLASSWS